jgi:hypothetical protein
VKSIPQFPVDSKRVVLPAFPEWDTTNMVRTNKCSYTNLQISLSLSLAEAID